MEKPGDMTETNSKNKKRKPCNTLPDCPSAKSLRPPNFHELTLDQQREIDKQLGLLPRECEDN
jgi:hypothetical protein